MALDPSVITGVKPVQLESPLQAMTQAMTLKSLANRNQIEGQQIADDQATRAAIKNNMIVGPDGQPTVDRQGTLRDLYQQAPQKAMELQTNWRQQDMAQQAAQLKQMQDQTAMKAQLMMGVTDQASLTAAKQKALQLGLTNADKLPDQYDPKLIQSIQFNTLSYKDQLDQIAKQHQLAIDQQKADTDTLGKRIEAQKAGVELRDKPVSDTINLIQSSKDQDPAVKQAHLDIYNANKADTLVKKVGSDPNKMDQTLYHTYIGEIGKIASGHAPTVEELKGMDPSTFDSQTAGLWSKVVSNPTPANLGAFVKQYQNYTNGVREDAKATIYDNNNRIVQSKAQSLSANPAGANQIKKQYLEPYAPTKSEKQKSDAQASNKPAWAK